MVNASGGAGVGQVFNLTRNRL